jgi:hypothetical protein
MSRHLDKSHNPQVLWFSYHAPTLQAKAISRYKGDLIDYSRSLHNLRDGGPFAYLLPVLLDIDGLEWGGLMLNLPANDFPPESRTAWLPSIQPLDLLVCVTRPPLSDHKEAAQRRAQGARARPTRIIQRSDTELERCVFRTLERFFLKYCSTSRIQLAAQMNWHTLSVTNNGAMFCSCRTIVHRSPGNGRENVG